MCRECSNSTLNTRKSMYNKGLNILGDFLIFEGSYGPGYFRTVFESLFR